MGIKHKPQHWQPSYLHAKRCVVRAGLVIVFTRTLWKRFCHKILGPPCDWGPRGINLPVEPPPFIPPSTYGSNVPLVSVTAYLSCTVPSGRSPFHTMILKHPTDKLLSALKLVEHCGACLSETHAVTLHYTQWWSSIWSSDCSYNTDWSEVLIYSYYCMYSCGIVFGVSTFHYT